MRVSGSGSVGPLGGSWGWSVAGVCEPGPGSAAVAFLGEGEPALQLVGVAGEDVCEAPERAAAGQGVAQPLGQVEIGGKVGEGGDEQLHAAVAGVGALPGHPQPTLRVGRVGPVGLLAEFVAWFGVEQRVGATRRRCAG